MQRDTRQRRAIRRVFMGAGRALTPDEVLEHGQQLVPSLGLATVYRNVKILKGEGWLSEVELPGGGVRYELAELYLELQKYEQAEKELRALLASSEAAELPLDEGFLHVQALLLLSRVHKEQELLDKARSREM